MTSLKQTQLGFHSLYTHSYMDITTGADATKNYNLTRVRPVRPGVKATTVMRVTYVKHYTLLTIIAAYIRK